MCVAIIFWPPADPSQRYKSETVWYVTQDQMVPVEKAIEEADAIIQRAHKLSKSGQLTPDALFQMQKNMKWLDKHSEQYGPNPRPGKSFLGMRAMGELAAVRDSDKKFRGLGRKEHERYRNLFDTDQEFKKIEKFRASYSENNWPIVAWRFVFRYMATVPLGIVVSILLILQKGKPLSYALATIFSHPFKAVLYPVGILWILGFMDEDYIKNCRRLISWLSYAMAASISVFFGGSASAQTIKKDDKKKDYRYALQLDNRVVAPIEGPPPSLFNRTTLNAKHWLAESITTLTPETRSWYNETGFGVKLIKTNRTTISGRGIVSQDSNGTNKIMAGVQYFRSGPIQFMAVPVARIEKTINGPTALAVVANPIYKLGRKGIRSRLALSPDVLVRKTFDKPLSWTAGLGFDVFPRKKKGDRIEAALLRTSTNHWQFRSRFVLNFAF